MVNVIVEKVEQWLWQIGIKKGVSFAVKAIIGIITGVKVAPILAQLGISVDPVTFEAGLATLVGSLLTIAQNYIKVKFGVTWL
jgi:hypothetical protein